MKKLPLAFYNRPTLKVSQDLLGKFLVRRIGNKKISGKIVEVEAYVGPDDLANHASRGKTQRNAVMFGPAGYVYVYLIYGMYYCLNFVTEEKNYPAAVLIRALELKNPLDKIASGPGKLCRYMKIDKKLNGEKLNGRKIWVEDRIPTAGVSLLGRRLRRENGTAESPAGRLRRGDIVKAKRIGVDYAKYCKNYQWRFYIKPSY